MKLLTLNTHSLQEENYLQKLDQFVEVIQIEQPDIIALQEVNQSIEAPLAGRELFTGWVPCKGGVPLRQDNHIAQISKRLNQKGISCSWTWVSAKIGYGKYDEGIAILCINQKIVETDSFFISSCRDYENWKTRKILGIKISGCDSWFYTVHMGWWQDEEEPFLAQWKRLDTSLQQKKEESTVWLMGDFNSPSEYQQQGYDCICSYHWKDTYQLANKKDYGITVEGKIDGWGTSTEEQNSQEGMRMDYIWCNKSIPIQSSRVLFNGIKEPIVSDHYGVLIETDVL